MPSRAANAARDGAIRASDEPTRVLADRFGITPKHVSRIRTSTPSLSRRERFQLEVVEGGWRAACMDDDEWQLWVERNPLAMVDGAIADRPCRDCPLGFAADMRAIGRCNGTPGAVGGEADHEEGDDEMTEPRITGGTTGRQQLALAPPPCGTCQHEPICALKVALKRATTAEVTAAPLPDGLTVTLEAKVDCRFYKRLKGASTWSPERRAKMSAAITASNRRRAEAAEGKAS